jgi:hypothetical protein
VNSRAFNWSAGLVSGCGEVACCYISGNEYSGSKCEVFLD